ncbi:MAG TPA: hypothetical protein VFZ65_05755 [Planctomycetota bacterium]|nr:hypothetical protein [Planctomycetota bacterium]
MILCGGIGLALQLLLAWPAAVLVGCFVGLFVAPLVPNKQRCGIARDGAIPR